MRRSRRQVKTGSTPFGALSCARALPLRNRRTDRSYRLGWQHVCSMRVRNEGGPMSLVRWEPWKELEKFFGYGPRFTREMTLAEWMPTVDIEENVEEYVVKAELPGLKREDVKVTYKDGVLALQGERR